MIPNNPKPKALVTLAVGDFYTQMGEITHPLMQSYAARCGVDFIVIDDRKVNEQYGLDERYEKFQLFDIIDHYDQVVFIDTDILISPEAPSLFELVPTDRFAAASEDGFSKAGRDTRVTQEILGPVEWNNLYFNSGVMVFGKQFKEVFEPSRESLKLWSTGEFREKEVNLLNDQPYLNHRLNELGIPLLDLGYKFNHTRVVTDTKSRFRSHMIHYAGPSGHRYGSRLAQLKKDAQALTSPLSFWLSYKFPAYRWLADRLDKHFLRYLISEKFSNSKT